jgi:hypothetical protein
MLVIVILLVIVIDVCLAPSGAIRRLSCVIGRLIEFGHQLSVRLRVRLSPGNRGNCDKLYGSSAGCLERHCGKHNQEHDQTLRPGSQHQRRHSRHVQ